MPAALRLAKGADEKEEPPKYGELVQLNDNRRLNAGVMVVRPEPGIRELVTSAVQPSTCEGQEEDEKLPLIFNHKVLWVYCPEEEVLSRYWQQLYALTFEYNFETVGRNDRYYPRHPHYAEAKKRIDENRCESLLEPSGAVHIFHFTSIRSKKWDFLGCCADTLYRCHQCTRKRNYDSFMVATKPRERTTFGVVESWKVELANATISFNGILY